MVKKINVSLRDYIFNKIENSEFKTTDNRSEWVEELIVLGLEKKQEVEKLKNSGEIERNAVFQIESGVWNGKGYVIS